MLKNPIYFTKVLYFRAIPQITRDKVTGGTICLVIRVSAPDYEIKYSSSCN
jgi:hypothetical protein